MFVCGLRYQLIAIATMLLLLVCAIADNYADHALNYNRDADQAKTSVLLTNIIRAAFREPLQFTDVTTVTGTATASAGIATQLPFFGNAAGMSQLYQINPMATISGGPSFTVATLNTKEFYQGILAPVPMQLISLYIQEGFPKQLLLSLLISEMHVVNNDGPLLVYNDSNSISDYLRFQDVLSELLMSGLTTEQEESVEVIGPPITVSNDRIADSIAKLRSQALDLIQKPTASGKSVFYAETKTMGYRFCFDPVIAKPGNRLRALGLIIGEENLCGYVQSKNTVSTKRLPALAQECTNFYLGPWRKVVRQRGQ
jgi:hypothetical protein